ncbi:hypothetical protein EWM64_g5628 [Hericium alpestre]|uniref:Uncharacterized protein n=1 Tax=Hericium alpestre TaxID=135208 RepID=A0A4Y9ZWE6_9AGAM|nr:hypothetical protein EWM64_g5628 [Hericium alpestre]
MSPSSLPTNTATGDQLDYPYDPAPHAADCDTGMAQLYDQEFFQQTPLAWEDKKMHLELADDPSPPLSFGHENSSLSSSSTLASATASGMYFASPSGHGDIDMSDVPYGAQPALPTALGAAPSPSSTCEDSSSSSRSTRRTTAAGSTPSSLSVTLDSGALSGILPAGFTYLR